MVLKKIKLEIISNFECAVMQLFKKLKHQLKHNKFEENFRFFAKLFKKCF